MTLEEVIDVMKEAEKDGQMAILASRPAIQKPLRGDPEQMDQLNELESIRKYAQGVHSSFCSAAAALGIAIHTAGYYRRSAHRIYGRRHLISRAGEHRLFRASQHNELDIYF